MALKAPEHRSRPAAALHADPLAASVDGRGPDSNPRGIPLGSMAPPGGPRGDKRAISIRTSLYLAHITVEPLLHHGLTIVAFNFMDRSPTVLRQASWPTSRLAVQGSCTAVCKFDACQQACMEAAAWSSNFTAAQQHGGVVVTAQQLTSIYRACVATGHEPHPK